MYNPFLPLIVAVDILGFLHDPALQYKAGHFVTQSTRHLERFQLLRVLE